MATKELEIETKWTGEGWYASRQIGQYENQRILVSWVTGTEGLRSGDYDEAEWHAKSGGQGTPFYAKQESDLEGA